MKQSDLRKWPDTAPSLRLNKSKGDRAIMSRIDRLRGIITLQPNMTFGNGNSNSTVVVMTITMMIKLRSVINLTIGSDLTRRDMNGVSRHCVNTLENGDSFISWFNSGNNITIA